MIKSVSNIEATRNHVYTVLTEFELYQEWLPGCTQSRILSQGGNCVETELTIQSIKTMTMVLRFELQPDQFLNFRMTQGKDLKSYQGSWRLMDQADGSGTVVMGEMEMDAGAMVPKFMVSRMAKKSIEATEDALRKRVRSVPPPKAALEAGQAAAPAKTLRPKRILQISKLPDGYRLWLMGETFLLRK